MKRNETVVQQWHIWVLRSFSACGSACWLKVTKSISNQTKWKSTELLFFWGKQKLEFQPWIVNIHIFYMSQWMDEQIELTVWGRLFFRQFSVPPFCVASFFIYLFFLVCISEGLTSTPCTLPITPTSSHGCKSETSRSEPSICFLAVSPPSLIYSFRYLWDFCWYTFLVKVYSRV